MMLMIRGWIVSPLFHWPLFHGNNTSDCLGRKSSFRIKRKENEDKEEEQEEEENLEGRGPRRIKGMAFPL